jgi:hypothetical protein
MPRAAKLATKRNTRGSGALLIGGAVAVLCTVLAYFNRSRAEEPSRAEFTGSIVITSADHNNCRHLTFDNVTGSIKDAGTRKCSNESNSQKSSLSEIAKSFR